MTPNLSQKAEEIVKECRFPSLNYDSDKKLKIWIKGILHQTREEAIIEQKEHCNKEIGKIRRLTYHSALEEAAKLVEHEHKYCEPPMCEIANKVRALASGSEEGKK